MIDQFKSFEKFTKAEAYFIEPFFTNLDKNVFAAKYLPSEVLGALASRYSRSTKGVRRLFFDEYIKPILEPDLEGVDGRSHTVMIRLPRWQARTSFLKTFRKLR